MKQYPSIPHCAYVKNRQRERERERTYICLVTLTISISRMSVFYLHIYKMVCVCVFGYAVIAPFFTVYFFCDVSARHSWFFHRIGFLLNWVAAWCCFLFIRSLLLHVLLMFHCAVWIHTHTLSLTHKSSRTQHRFHYIECAHLTLTALTYSLTDSASQLVYFKYTHYMHAPMNCFSYEPGRCQRHLHVHRVLTKQYYYNIIAWCNVAETSTNIWRIRVLNGFCVHLPLHYCPFFGILK